MTFFQSRKKQDRVTKNRVIPLDLSKQWADDFKLKYYELRESTDYSNFGENIALYVFLYVFLNCEFEDLTLCNKTKQIEKYTDRRVFTTTNLKRVTKDIDEFIKTL